MNLDQFSQHNRAIRCRVRTLYRRAMQPPEPDLLPDALQELQATIEALQVAEEELRQQNEELITSRLLIEVERQRYYDLFEFAPDGYLVTDRMGIIREANRAAARLVNMGQAKLLNKPLVSLIAREERSTFRTRLNQIVQTQTPQEWEVQLQVYPDQRLYASLKVDIQLDAEGQTIALRWMVRDMTQHKQAEQQLLALNADLMQRSRMDELLWQIEAKFRDTFDPAAILTTAVQELATALGLLACDAARYDIPRQQSTVSVSYTAPNQEGLPPSYPGVVDMQIFPAGYAQLLGGQEFQFCELTTDPARQAVSMLACPIADQQEIWGDIWCFSPRQTALTSSQVYLVRQVANRCAIALRQADLHRENQKQMAELKQLNHLKDDFLSTVSHELRTPLTNMKMALHVLPMVKTEEQRTRCLTILRTECDREIDLITDLLDLQQLEAGKHPNFMHEAVFLPTWLPTILAPFWQRSAAQEQQLQVSIPETLPTLVTDQASLRRVLVELLRNAHKYTPSNGLIELAIEYQAEHHSMMFYIRNQAQIPAVELGHLFDKFYRVPHYDPWSQGGTGLGLSLVKQLVTYLQGVITLTSHDGWTTFSLTLPLRLSDA